MPVGWTRLADRLVCANPGAVALESSPMPLRKLIDRGSYAPEALAVIFEAFDSAWTEIAGRFEIADPSELNLARNRLAQAVLAVATANGSNVSDVSELKLQALAAFDQMSALKEIP